MCHSTGIFSRTGDKLSWAIRLYTADWTMNLMRFLLALSFAACGIAFGALNSESITIDLYFWQLRLSVGLSLLMALFLGALIGGIAVTVGSVLPNRRRIDEAAARARAKAVGEPERM